MYVNRNEVVIHAAHFDRIRALVIDPTIIWTKRLINYHQMNAKSSVLISTILFLGHNSAPAARYHTAKPVKRALI